MITEGVAAANRVSRRKKKKSATRQEAVYGQAMDRATLSVRKCHEVDEGKKIEDVKLLNFCFMTTIESANKIYLPDQVDHLPPEFLQIIQD